ncbi:MAG: pilus assembly PilX N-terminal domain-containing protein [Gammaproteobacteria bacterium]|nr:pilus assembly PilX N-terminal domain-containing protein [Gammaproteobacteria bacterium]MCF6231091.1 pilus assembly PilX N-terminal domain-containing protein [Gammaproteobacteria bacterium]
MAWEGTQQTVKRQRGIATLMISLILLFSITMMTLYAANNTMTETRIAANDYRSKLAYEAAQAGLEATIAALQTVANRSPLDDGNEVDDADGFIDSNGAIQPTVTLSNGSSYQVSYSNPIQHDTSLIVITATGRSDDNSGVKTISQAIQLLPLAMDIPSAGLVTGGGVTVTAPEPRQSNTVSTTQSTLATPRRTTESSCQNSRTTRHASPSPGSLFDNTFKIDKATLKNSATTVACTHCSVGSFIGIAGGIAWLEGDIRIAGNGTLGSHDKPILIVVDGDLTMVGNMIYNGLIYTTGDYHASAGTLKINGAVIVEGNFSATDALCILYKPAILNNVGKAIGPIGKIAGSWRDF